MRTVIIQRKMRSFLLLLATLFAASAGVESFAQTCTTSSDGMVEALLGTDFDRSSTTTGSTFNIGSIFANAPKGMVILPNDEFTATTGYSDNANGNLQYYDPDVNHFDYDWLKENNMTGQVYKIYTVTDSLHKMFPKGKGIPFNYADGSNSFYVTSANPRGVLAAVYFPWDIFRGRSLKLSYKMYIIIADTTKFCDYYMAGATMGIGGHNAAGGYSGVTITLTSDTGESVECAGGNGISVTGSNWETGSLYFPNSTYTYDCGLDHMACYNCQPVLPNTDYGWTVSYDFKFVNYNTTTFNNLIYYPYLNFSNADMYRVVIDYINIKMEHLCVDKDEVCPGDTVTVTAVDFNSDAELEWQYTLDGTNWVVFDNTKYSENRSVKFKFPETASQIVFRARQTAGSTESDVDVTGGYSLEVVVNAKSEEDCTPAIPTIKGDAVYCTPANAIEYKIEDPQDGVKYIWTLLDNYGNDVTTRYLNGDGGNNQKVYLSIPASAAEGKYTLKVYGRRDLANLASDYASFSISVHNTPSITVTMTDMNGNTTNEICPATGSYNKLVLTAVPASSGDYTYVWSGAATAMSTDPSKATLSVPTDVYCDYVGSTPYINAAVTATRYGCSVTQKVSYPVTKAELPTINCHNANYSYNLAATENSHAVTITLPTYSTQCGDEPTLDVTAVHENGTAVTVSVDKSAGTLTGNFTLGKTTITYTVTDGCGHKASCSDVVTMVDNNKPNLNCSLIPSYSTKLSYYGDDTCSAYQGKGTRPDLLPVITAPVLEDLDHPGEMLTGVFVRRSDAGLIANSFAPGQTTITWRFYDASGNYSECTSTVTVVDDKLPVVVCPTISDEKFATDDDVCYATFDNLMAQLGDLDLIPSGVDACHSNASVSQKVFVKGGAFSTWTEFNSSSNIQLQPDVEYTLQYRFYRVDVGSTGYVDTDVYQTCEQTITVVDKQSPTFDCSQFNAIFVPVNQNDDIEYEYASGVGTDAGTTYSLANSFSIPAATDNCSGEIYPVITVTIPNSTGTSTTTTVIDATVNPITALEELKALEFYVGTSTLKYVYTDDKGNSTECSFTVVVTAPNAPVTDCPTPPNNVIYLYADDNCQASTNGQFSLATIPSAVVNYAYTIYNINTRTGSYTTNTQDKSVTVYPYQILRQHTDTEDPADLGDAEQCTNTSSSYKYATLEVQYNGKVFGYGSFTSALKTVNYTANPDCNRDTFPIGLTRITYEFRNGAARSYCYYDIIVRDTTPPTVVCDSRFNGTYTFYTDTAHCSYAIGDLYSMGLTAGHKGRLGGHDNCSEYDDWTLDWYRISNGQSERYLSRPNFEIGDHYLGYRLKDKAGNFSEYCVQHVVIADTMGPRFDCSSLDSIIAFADANCVASSEAVIEAGLIVPVAEDDACSPTGSLITAVGTRSDNLTLNDAYPLGTTTIKWTFADAVPNYTYCYQDVIVKDTTKPVFDDCGNLPDLTLNTTLEVCTVSKAAVLSALGSHQAIDNCGGSIEGVPGLGDDGTDPLLDEFPVGKYVIVWRFDDGTNVTLCYQNLSVEDNVPPSTEGVCPSDQTVDAVLGSCEQDLGLSELTINDPCDGVLTSVSSRDDGRALSEPFVVGNTVVTYTFTDNSDNKSYCKQTITVEDVTPPVLECFDAVNDSIIFHVDDDNCYTSSSEIVKAVQEPNAYDECDSVSVTSVSQRWYTGRTGSSTPVLVTDGSGNPVTWDDASVPYEQGYTDIYFIFTDASGNADTCIVNVYVLDENKPKIDCGLIPNPVELNPDENKCDVDITNAKLLTLNGVKAVDICSNTEIEGTPINADGGDLVNPSIPKSLSSGDTLNITWFYISELKAQVQCPQKIFVTDNQKPKFDCLSLTQIDATADSGKCSVNSVSIPVPKAQDNCGTIDGVPTRSDSLDITAPFPTGYTTITWTFSDTNPLNDVTCEQTVFVHGSVAPEIQCDTIRDLFDTIPDCDVTVQNITVTVPVAIDYCAPADQQQVPGTFVRSDGETDLNAPFPLGTTLITWTFTDFTNSVSSQCVQRVNVRTSKDLDKTCPDNVKESVNEGECSKEIELTAPVAQHPCLASVVDTGIPYINGAKIALDANGKFKYNFPLSTTRVLWIFTDTTESLVKSVDTCVQLVQVGNDASIPLDCPTDYPDIKKVLSQECSINFTELGQEVKIVPDKCYGPFTPTIWLSSDSAATAKVVDPSTEVDNSDGTYTYTGAALSYTFSVGVVDTINWKYVMQRTATVYDTVVCHQQVWIQDEGNLDYICDNVPNMNIKSDAGECYASADSVLAQIGEQFATDKCLTYKIPGVPTLENGDPLPNRFAVGTIYEIKWTFNDSLANADTIICHQKLRVIGDQPPVYDECDSLNVDTIKYIADGVCSYALDFSSLVAPVAKDYCTGDNVVGVPYNEGGHEIKDGYVFPLGYSLIRWVFTSPYSSVSSTCTQPVYVRTNLEADTKCDELANTVIEADVLDCEIKWDDLNITIPSAVNPCNNAPLVVTTDYDTSNAFVAGVDTFITWYFVDTTGTLVTSEYSCTQPVKINDARIIDPNYCDNFQTKTYELGADDCELSTNELNIDYPALHDDCADEDVVPTYSRYSGLTLADAWSVGAPDTLYWKFTLSNGYSLTCPQAIIVLDSLPEFDCSSLPDTLLKADEAACYIQLDLKQFVADNYSALAVATDPCTGTLINGAYAYEFESTVGWPDRLYTGEEYNIIWTFKDENLNANAKTCTQTVKVDGVGFSVDCDVLYSDINRTTDECKLSYSDLAISGMSVDDNCSSAVYVPTPSRFSGKDLTDDYELGYDTIYWQYVIHERVSVCKQAVIIKNDMVPFDCSDIKTLDLAADPSVCSMDTLDISQKLSETDPYPTATPVCTDPIRGVFSYPAGTAEKLSVGESVVVTWTFSDTLHFDFDKVCYQTVNIKNEQPEFDCSSLTDLHLAADADNCSLDTATISKALDALKPYPTSEALCGFPVTGVHSFKNTVDGGAVSVDQVINVKWLFSDPEHYINDKVCSQDVYVDDSTAPNVKCADKVAINVQLTVGDSASYADLVNNGFEEPTLIFDCSDVTMTFSRSDNKAMFDNYPIGETTITWTATDDYGNSSQCVQVVNVIDKVIPTLTCIPPLDTTYTCSSFVPEVYETFEEFKMAGGKVSDESKVAGYTFAHEDLYDIEQGNTIDCGSVLHRTYYFLENSLISCTHIYRIKDSLPPVWNEGVELINTKVISCEDSVPYFPASDFLASDNCSADVTYDSSMVNMRGTDPNACDYYSYDIVYKYWAADNCGNVSDTLFYTIQVRDTVGPVVDVDDDWSDKDTLRASYLKGCNFGVPNLLDYLPDGAITDNCQPVGNLRMEQVPAAGDTIYKTQYVSLFIYDLCDNVTELKKIVYVPEPESVVKISAQDTTVCGSDVNPLRVIDPQISRTTGKLWKYDDGEWFEANNAFFYDIYLDQLDADNIVFSTNDLTYGKMFTVNGSKTGSAYNEYRTYMTKLHRTTRSGHYIIVAMDTMTLCSDTAEIDIKVIEKPRVALDSMELAVCHLDSMSLNEMYSNYNVCVADMGAEVTDEGWMYGGEIYEPNSKIYFDKDNGKKVTYYATNFCGTTSSDNSLFISCSSYPANAADSLEAAGSAENYQLLKQDSLYVDNHLVLDIHNRYDQSRLVLSTDPQDKARVWIGDNATLALHTDYKPAFYQWYKVVGDFDGRVDSCYNADGTIKDGYRILGDTEDEMLSSVSSLNDSAAVSFSDTYDLIALTDTATYYVLVGDNVCPATASNLVSVDVITHLPTAITPYTQDGLNDVFLAGHHVFIFNRYGQTVYEGYNGWDGTYRGLLADPGVYFYQVEMNGGVVLKGSVEVVKIK